MSNERSFWDPFFFFPQGSFKTYFDGFKTTDPFGIWYLLLVGTAGRGFQSQFPSFEPVFQQGGGMDKIVVIIKSIFLIETKFSLEIIFRYRLRRFSLVRTIRVYFFCLCIKTVTAKAKGQYE